MNDTYVALVIIVVVAFIVLEIDKKKGRLLSVLFGKPLYQKGCTPCAFRS